MNSLYLATHRALISIRRRITPSGLAGLPEGRMVLHLLCACRDGKLRWHWQGIVREINRVSGHCSQPVRLLERATSLHS